MNETAEARACMSRSFHSVFFLLIKILLNARVDRDYVFATSEGALNPHFSPTECSRCCSRHFKTSAIVRSGTSAHGCGAHLYASIGGTAGYCFHVAPQSSRERIVKETAAASFRAVEINRSPVVRPSRRRNEAKRRRSCVGGVEKEVSSGQYQHEDDDRRGHSRENAADWPLGLPPALIRADGVSKTYARRRWFESHREVVALHKTSLVLEGPGPFAFVGNSGSGKSTFLQLVCGRCSPSGGNVRIEISGPEAFVGLSNTTEPRHNKEPEAGEAGDVAVLRASTEPYGITARGVYIDRLSIGTMVQNPVLSIADAMAGVLIDADGDPRRVNALRRSIQIVLEATGLAESLHKRCKDLTRGQRLRLVLSLGVAHALAGLKRLLLERRADVLDPKDGSEIVPQVAAGPVLCLDEFLDMEDPRVRKPVEDAVAGLCAVGVTILFATHIMEHVEGMTDSVQRVAPTNERCDGLSCKVVVFSRGGVAGISRLEDSSYVQWKKNDSAERGARRII